MIKFFFTFPYNVLNCSSISRRCAFVRFANTLMIAFSSVPNPFIALRNTSASIRGLNGSYGTTVGVCCIQNIQTLVENWKFSRIIYETKSDVIVYFGMCLKKHQRVMAVITKLCNFFYGILTQRCQHCMLCAICIILIF